VTWQVPDFLSNHTSTEANYNYGDTANKPVEIYLFMDPFSEECWFLDSYLKKLSLEYGRFFTVRAILSSRFTALESETHPVAHPWIPSLAIKASELQGKRAGKVFLRKLQERLFIDNLNVSNMNVLLKCAEEANLDIQEFENDLLSASAKKAYQCDMRLTNEMDVEQLPTVVYFNQVVEEHGIKVSGLYSYEVYELVLSEILQYHPIPSEKPPLEELIVHSSIIQTEEISIIYDWSVEKTMKEMKKLQLQQRVDRIDRDDKTYWIPKF
jgi:predicted DsbA family dithiol-disulfide isomerase